MILRRLVYVLLPLAGTLLAGCASHEPLPSFFVLTPDAAAGARSGSRPAEHGARIFIRRVDIPGYLQSTKLASRRADTQVEYAPTANWAEALNDGVAQAVGAAIDRSSRATVVGAIGGGVPPARDYDLKISLERFEGDDRGEVVLLATWSLFAPEAATPLLTRRSRWVQTGWQYGDYPALAKLLGRDLSEFGGEIARACPR